MDVETDQVSWTIRRRGALVLAIAALAGGCGTSGEGGVSPGVTVDTLASGRIVVRNPDIPSWPDGEAWTLRERFRLGSLDGPDATVFGAVSDLELDETGNLYVLDGQASEVRVFDAEGRHLRTIGGPGEGPGELNGPAGMAFGPDGNLWVMNWQNARFTAFDPATGGLAEERRRLASFAMLPWPGAFDRAGRLLDVGLDRSGDTGGEPALLLLDTAFVPTDTLPLPSADDRYRIAVTRGGLMVMSIMQPFAPQPAWTPHPEGGIAVGEGGAYRIHRIEFGGDTTLSFELAREPIEVSAAERDSALTRMRETLEEVDGTPEAEPTVAERKPAHGTLLVDPEGNTWVRATPGPGERPRWDVFDADGRYLGGVPVPDRMTYVPPSIRNDRMAIAVEEEGIPGVIVYDIARP